MEHHHDVNLLWRREILAAYVTVLSQPAALFRVCAHSSDDTIADEIAHAFNVRPEAAEAILDLQIRRFTPHALDTVTQDLAEVELRVRDNGCESCDPTRSPRQRKA